MKNIFLLLFLFWLNLNNTFSQNNSGSVAFERKVPKPTAIASFENQLQSAIQKVAPASVLIITYEQLAGHTGMMASGVCVSEDGFIMTAGHMTVPEGNYEIVFPDGRSVHAKGLGKIGKLDAGLLKIAKEGKYPFAEMGWSSNLKPGERCFSLAYPGSFPRKMVARMGHVEKVAIDFQGDVRSNHILNTCVMEPGDSGGPLFDFDGKVIGIRSYIGLPVEENYDVPVDVFRKYWKALKMPVDYRHYPDGEDLEVSKNSSHRSETPDIEASINALAKELSKYSINITSDDKSAFGTHISPEGLISKKKASKRTFIISKSSEVGSNPKVFLNGKSNAAKVLYRDENRDLVLLQADGKSENAISLTNIHTDSIATGSLGELLISPKPNGSGEISALGTLSFELPAVYYAGYLGMRLEKQADKNVITTVQPNTAASKGGLKVGDEILKTNGIEVENPEVFIGELQTKKPGDVISVVRVQANQRDTINITLEARPFKGINHVADRFTAGRSDRRDGFKSVFIHSADLQPSECGGPVFNVNKELVGINLARYSRISSLAVPGKEVIEFLKAAVKAK